MRSINYFIIVIIFFTYSCNKSFYNVGSINSNTTIIKRGNIESVIFSKDAHCFLCQIGVNRFTPTMKQINDAEEILIKNIRSANNPMYNQGNGCPIIHKNLKNYRRQYFGYIDNEGNKILYVNFLWAKYTIFDRLKGYHKDESENWKT